MAEIERCAKDPGLRRGLKLHFGNSDVDLDDSTHVVQLQRVFREANRHRMAIVVHMRSNTKRTWGAGQARVFLQELLPAAPNVPVQIAHLAGAGGYEDPGIDAAIGVFADAIAARDKRMKRVYFEVSGVFLEQWESKVDLIAKRLRTIGLDRILYGSDGPPLPNWRAFRKLPLTEEEFRKIEGKHRSLLEIAARRRNPEAPSLTWGNWQELIPRDSLRGAQPFVQSPGGANHRLPIAH